MLQTLNIENVALIDKAVLEFDEKLNVISGETGAGKSIMLDSLVFVFGGRADRTLIRSGAQKMKVEAVFSGLNKNQIALIKDELDINAESELFLQRELDINGKNHCKINGELVPVASVKKVCSRLIDIHGQSEHLAILNNDYQLEIVDLFSKTVNEDLVLLNELIEQVKEIEKQIKDLGGSASERQNLIDLYSFQLNELNELNIKANEFEDLTNEMKAMQQFEKVTNNLKLANENLNQNSFSTTANESVNQALKALQNISEVNEEYMLLYNRLNSLQIELNDIADFIKQKLYNNVFDEDRFNFVDARLDKIRSAFRKYGGNFEKLNSYKNEISLKLDNLTNSEEKRLDLENKKEKLLVKIDALQDKISSKRKKSAVSLSSSLVEELKFLGMPNAKMDIEFSKISERYSLSGYDRVEFMFSANLGFELKPLNKVVSGGEMSRVMLAYKIVVGSVDNISTIIFDEVDTGLSGKIATVVSQYLHKLSKLKQVIAVSHLPQICAMANHNIKVEKYSDKTTTHTRASVLNEKETLIEIARLMGAVNNDNGLNAAKELKLECEKFKQ